MIKTALLAATTALVALPAVAAPVNGTGNVTPDVIFGSGNANGSFTGTVNDGVELALRGKLRYDSNGQPQNTFNYDGDSSYFFTNIGNAVPANRAVFNFEFSINTDVDGLSGRTLDDLTYALSVDTDAGAGTNFFTFDPCALLVDNALGNNSTGNGDGTPGACAGSGLNVAQNSQNLGFGYTPNDPRAAGQYTFSLSAFDGQQLIGTTTIDVFVDASPVPAPAALGLLGFGLLGLGAARKRA
ncbi:hypothetical protein KCG44_00160 [Pacificimonas sp. WHA3]|uniref:PEP-CTERM protein-sorting domain-containing protein n=1 Tax=Pacificimonas pallii TaxID=2827236 RepID=A0ABS6S9Z4_9SPHN|nr:hypothetical protein [Pacificimonas pallii]MBV7255187.1 hypothetical protein [Pacificimonas pallii]